jgi:hypothetical protein
MFQFGLHGGVPGNGLKVSWMERTKRIKYTRKRRERHRRAQWHHLVACAGIRDFMLIPQGSAELRRYYKRDHTNS